MFKLVVLSMVLALAAAKPSVVVPLAYSGLPAVSSSSQYSVHGSSVVPAVYGTNYGLTYPSTLGLTTLSAGYPVALAQPAHSPAVILDAVNGVPLDTPEVVAARAAHYQAKALAGHHLAKRSLTPLTYSSVVPAVVPSYTAGYGHSFVAPVSPLGYSAHLSPVSPLLYTSPYTHAAVVPKALSIHPY